MSITRFVNVMCDWCGAPASDAVWNARDARKLVPLTWRRVKWEGRNCDVCPTCFPTIEWENESESDDGV